MRISEAEKMEILRRYRPYEVLDGIRGVDRSAEIGDAGASVEARAFARELLSYLQTVEEAAFRAGAAAAVAYLEEKQD